MLTVFNDLEPFFQDNYRRIHVREYSRIKKISPPFASKTLHNYEKEGLLIKEKDKKYLLFHARRESSFFKTLSQAYWVEQLRRSGLITYLEQELVQALVLVFGSIVKAEVTPSSDLDLAVFTPTLKELDLEPFEKKLKRKIQLFRFKHTQEVPNPDLLGNLFNGVRILGHWNGLENLSTKASRKTSIY